MRAVFVDSGFWIALRDQRDEYHAVAKTIASRLLRTQTRLVTTPFIFAEVHARFSRSTVLRERVIRDFWENPVVVMETPGGQDQSAALEVLREQQDKSYSYCDALSFSLMERMGLREVVSFDDHFRQIGTFDVISE